MSGSFPGAPCYVTAKLLGRDDMWKRAPGGWACVICGSVLPYAFWNYSYYVDGEKQPRKGVNARTNMPTVNGLIPDKVICAAVHGERDIEKLVALGV